MIRLLPLMGTAFIQMAYTLIGFDVAWSIVYRCRCGSGLYRIFSYGCKCLIAKTGISVGGVKLTGKMTRRASSMFYAVAFKLMP